MRYPTRVAVTFAPAMIPFPFQPCCIRYDLLGSDKFSVIYDYRTEASANMASSSPPACYSVVAHVTARPNGDGGVAKPDCHVDIAKRTKVTHTCCKA